MVILHILGLSIFKLVTGYKQQCPTAVVPFFGDQPFWGERVHARGVGPAPIPIDGFSLDKLIDAIKFMLDPEVLTHYFACLLALLGCWMDRHIVHFSFR